MNGITDECQLAIRLYFQSGYTNCEICSLLSLRHDIHISVRTLKRRLYTLGLRRTSNNVDNEKIIRALQSELEGSGSCLGYRSMTERLRNIHGLRVSRNLVMRMLRYLDPEGVSLRKSHRFKRRAYTNKGPNYLVHIDGYDKIKPFGFAIHGAICGFSRRILWLKAGSTNNDPYTVARYFVEYVETIEGVPRCLRMDRGTENIFIEDIQKAFRWSHIDEMAGDKSVLYGSSHRNQRIERWWRTLRENGINWWINFFKDLESQGTVATDNKLHVECLRFSFMELIQLELDHISTEWNQHRFRRTEDNVNGKPDLLYNLPHEYGTVDYKYYVKEEDILAVKAMCTPSHPSGCQPEFYDICLNLLQLHGKTRPQDIKDALQTFQWLVSKLE